MKRPTGTIEIGQPVSIESMSEIAFPFGTSAHIAGTRFLDAKGAIEIIESFKQLGRQTRTGFIAPMLPLYVGHPDVPGRKESNPNAPAVGWIIALHMSGEKLVAQLKLGPEGERAIKERCYALAEPLWVVRPAVGGVEVFQLVSVGLVNQATHIAPPAANSAPLRSHTPASAEVRRAKIREVVATAKKEIAAKQPNIPATTLHEQAWAQVRRKFPALFDASDATIPKRDGHTDHF
jgi:hypothetical protein